MSIEAQGAERAILSILIKSPDKLFEINDVVSSADFSNTGSAMIFDILKKLITEDGVSQVDKAIISAEADRQGLESYHHYTLNGELVDALFNIKANPSNLGRYVADVKQCSIKRALLYKCDDIKDRIESYIGPSIELRNLVESEILDSLKKLDSEEDDIVNLADDFEEVIETYADREGDIGIDFGFPRWQQDIGHVRNGSVTGLFARSKVGKSQLSMWSMYVTALMHRKPTLYLDTELQARQQQMRLCGIITKIPYNRIESGQWKYSKTEIAKIKEAFKLVEDSPLFYKNISGRSTNNVIPVIRKFTYNSLGGPISGDDPKGLVIYDYIKLMDSGDLRHMQEYQLIGLLMSKLHDCAANLNIPILALGQLNKQEDIGIDRIIHNVDSASILRPKSKEELADDGPDRGTHVIEVKYCRNGPGHDYDEWINFHFDKSCGQFTEDKRSTEVMTVVKRLKEHMEDEQMQKLSDAKERF